jgi:hypothetical protein
MSSGHATRDITQRRRLRRIALVANAPNPDFFLHFCQIQTTVGNVMTPLGMPIVRLQRSCVACPFGTGVIAKTLFYVFQC